MRLLFHKMQVAVQEALKPLNWLIGKWISISAKGSYPTIKPFQYNEEIEFTSIGQPMLNYSLRSWNPETQKPMHFEFGFLRIKPGTNKVAFMVAHNFGLTSLEEGTVGDNELKVTSTQVSRMSFAVDPAVIGIERHFKLAGDTLECIISMETENIPLTEHLKIIYKKG